MQLTKLYCDRCGADMDSLTTLPQLMFQEKPYAIHILGKAYDYGVSLKEKEFDLCADCARWFEQWWTLVEANT